jgi:hypothetical protein
MDVFTLWLSNILQRKKNTQHLSEVETKNVIYLIPVEPSSELR